VVKWGNELINKKISGVIFSHIAGLFLIAFLARILAFMQVPIINVDGIVYIQQARAIYYHQPQGIFASYEYLTNYAPLIALVYHFVGNWVLSAQIISLFFSLLVIIPFYFLAFNYWGENRACFLTFLYVVSPTFVGLSPDIIRGPEFWFFYVAGLWAFSVYLHEKHYFSLVIALFALFLAAWSRIEGIWPLFLVSGWFVFTRRHQKNWNRMVVTCGLFVVLCIVFLLLITSYLGIDFNNVIYSGLSNRISFALSRVAFLNDSLRQMAVTSQVAVTPQTAVLPNFFVHARHFLWLLAIGVTGHSILKVFSLPVIGLWLTGFFCSRKINVPVGGNQSLVSIRFISVLLVGSLLLLYAQIFLNWENSSRYCALIYFPSLLLLGNYLTPLVACINKRLRLRTSLVYLILALLVFSFSLPEILREGHGGKRVSMMNIGLALAEQREPGKTLKLLGTTKDMRYVHFYAHLLEPGAPSVYPNCTIKQPSELSSELIEQLPYDYLLVLESDGSRQRFLKLQSACPDIDLRLVMEVSSEKYGRISVFKRNLQAVRQNLN